MREIMYNWGAPCITLYRFGPSEPVANSLTDIPVELNARQCINASAHRSRIDETARLLLSSSDGSTRSMYLGNWTLWVDLRRVRKISPWMRTTTHRWDQDVLGFLTWGHTFIKNWGVTLSARLRAIRFLHLVGGSGVLKGSPFAPEN